jgi:hypothetical protein
MLSVRHAITMPSDQYHASPRAKKQIDFFFRLCGMYLYLISMYSGLCEYAYDDAGKISRCFASRALSCEAAVTF